MGAGIGAVRHWAILLLILSWIFGAANARISACDVDLICLLENEAASVPGAVPWIRAARAVSSLSDALNAGAPASETIDIWNNTTAAVTDPQCVAGGVFRAEMSSLSRRIQELMRSGNSIDAHEALQRQFRLILQGIGCLEMPLRVSALARLAGMIWSLVETARDRDARRFKAEITGLASATKALEAGWDFPDNSPLEPVRYWVDEVIRVSREDVVEWPDQLLLAVSQLKNSLVQLHRFMRTGIPGSKKN